MENYTKGDYNLIENLKKTVKKIFTLEVTNPIELESSDLVEHAKELQLRLSDLGVSNNFVTGIILQIENEVKAHEDLIELALEEASKIEAQMEYEKA